MARVAYGNGIGYSIVTPHTHPGRYENSALSIDSGWGLFFENTMAIVQTRVAWSDEIVGAAMLRMCAGCTPAQQQPRH